MAIYFTQYVLYLTSLCVYPYVSSEQDYSVIAFWLAVHSSMEFIQFSSDSSETVMSYLSFWSGLDLIRIILMAHFIWFTIKDNQLTQS